MTEPTATVDATRRTALNVVFSAVSQIAGKVLTLVWTLAAARLLDAADFGVFFYALAAATLVTTLSEWGFDPVLVREASRAPERLGALTGAALRLEFAIAVPALAVSGLLVSQSQDGPEHQVAVLLVFAGALLEVLSDTARAGAQAAQRQGGTATALVVQRLATAALIIAALLLGFDLVGLSVGFLLGTVVGAAGHAIALARLGLRLTPGWRKEIRPLVATSWFVGASAIALIALSKVDTLLLQALRGSREVGLYAATYRLLDTTLFFAFALSSGIFPAISASGRAEDASSGIRAGLGVAALVYAPFAAICLVDSGALLRLLFGGQFVGAAPALAWLAFAAMPYTMAYLGNGALQALDLGGWLLGSAVAAVVLNVVANLALIPDYGATGAGAATAIAYLVEAAIVLAVLRRARGVRVRPVGALLIPSAVAGAYAGLLWLLPWPALVEIGVGGAAYLTISVALIARFRPADLEFLRSLRSRRAPVSSGPIDAAPGATAG